MSCNQFDDKSAPGTANGRASRRRFMTTAMAIAASLAGSRISSALAADAGTSPDLVGLPSKEDIWRDLVHMNDMGPRYTGTAAHRRYMAFLDERLAGLGLAVEHIPHSSLVLWEPVAWSLKTASGKDITVANICRWSAVTGPTGVTGPVKFCGRLIGPSKFSASAYPGKLPHIDIPADIGGKIALIEVMADLMSWKDMFGDHINTVVDPTHAGGLPPVQSSAWACFTNENSLPADFEAQLRKAGAIGVIYAWVNGADADAQGQHKRNGTPALPSLWVGHTAGEELRALAEQGTPVTMMVDAKITNNVPTATTIATLPGQSADEIIVLWSHTDGMNATEENGGIAILNLVKYFASLPMSARRRTIVCVLTEGHMAIQYLPDQAWLKDRPDLAEKAVTAFGMEHFGCQEWVSDLEKNRFYGTGRPEIVWAFCQAPPDRPNPQLQLMLDALKGSRAERTAVIDRSDRAFGPGLLTWRFGNIPTVAYITTPAYFLSEAPNGHIDKLSPELFHDQVQSLARAIRLADQMPKHELRPS